MAVLGTGIDGTHLADYSYLGLASVVEQDSTEAHLRYTLLSLTGSNDPDTGDIYSGYRGPLPRIPGPPPAPVPQFARFPSGATAIAPAVAVSPAVALAIGAGAAPATLAMMTASGNSGGGDSQPAQPPSGSSPSGTPECPVKYHYTKAPECAFQKGLMSNSSVTDKLYDSAILAGQELGIPTPNKVMPI